MFRTFALTGSCEINLLYQKKQPSQDGSYYFLRSFMVCSILSGMQYAL